MLVTLFLGFVSLALTFGAAIAFFDASRRSSQAFQAVGRGTRGAWMIGMAASAVIIFFKGPVTLFGLIATVATIVYHVDQKPKLIDIITPRW